MLVTFQGGDYDGEELDLPEPLNELEELPRPTGAGPTANLRYRLRREGQPIYVYEHSMPPASG
ncbi:MAG TPA: hypothetical protein VK009_11615 [Chloroflexota bacterium]|nr:hypothetical protein [Chloroflexota bacterium]